MAICGRLRRQADEYQMLADEVEDEEISACD
jgi:hypothetical protein